MMETISEYDYRNLTDIDIPDFAPSNLGWAIVDRFPTKEYTETKERLAPSGVANVDTTAFNEWLEDEDYRDYIDEEAYNAAPIAFHANIEDDMPGGDCDDGYTIRINLRANTQEDIDYMTDIIEETRCCTTHTDSGATIFFSGKGNIPAEMLAKLIYEHEDDIKVTADTSWEGEENPAPQIRFEIKGMSRDDADTLVTELNEEMEAKDLEPEWYLAD